MAHALLLQELHAVHDLPKYAPHSVFRERIAARGTRCNELPKIATFRAIEDNESRSTESSEASEALYQVLVLRKVLEEGPLSLRPLPRHPYTLLQHHTAPSTAHCGRAQRTARTFVD
jgi:hypothetical protein